MIHIFRKTKSCRKMHFFVPCKIEVVNKKLFFHLVEITLYQKQHHVNHIYWWLKDIWIPKKHSFFISYLYVPQLTFGHCRGRQPHCPWYLLDPKANRRLATYLGPKAQPSTKWGLNRDPSDSQCNAFLTH